MTQEKSHSLHIGKHRIGIYHENKRLFKFVSWNESKMILKEYLLTKVLESNPTLKGVEGLDINMESVNPMRRSMLGNFYLDVKGEILDAEGMVIAKFLDLDIKHVSLDGFTSHDEDENLKRAETEKRFGNDQYSKELSIRTQAVDEILNTAGGSITLDSSNTETVDSFIEQVMKLTGWTSKEDNRIHSRIKRLPLYMEVPE